MPQYKVIAPGFFQDLYYHPEGKRKVLHTDEPFTQKNPLPSWLTEMPKETSAAKSKRKAKDKADKVKAKSDKEDIDDASLVGEGEKPSFIAKGSKVETL